MSLFKDEGFCSLDNLRQLWCKLWQLLWWRPTFHLTSTAAGSGSTAVSSTTIPCKLLCISSLLSFVCWELSVISTTNKKSFVKKIPKFNFKENNYIPTRTPSLFIPHDMQPKIWILTSSVDGIREVTGNSDSVGISGSHLEDIGGIRLQSGHCVSGGLTWSVGGWDRVRRHSPALNKTQSKTP